MMKIFTKILALSLLVVLAMVAPVSAAKPVGNGGGKPAAESTPVGNDVSWPQCGKTLPTDKAFGIVGVNGGLATTTNPCLADQLIWAHSSSGAANQPKAQLYVNTANPGQVLEQYQVTSWPTDNIDPLGNNSFNNPDESLRNPHGECVVTPGNYGGYTNSLACSWQYGWNRAVEAVKDRFSPAATEGGVDINPAAYVWWLDVETENSWQEGAATDLAKNVATLEAMTAYYESIGAKVGLYSTNYQWGLIVGNQVQANSNLNGLDSWLAGARNLKDSQTRCKSAVALTAGGEVTLYQYVSKNLDYNFSCI